MRAAKLALMIAQEGGHDVADAVAWSDSFFPFPDGPQVLTDAGVKVIFASSSSVNDKLVIEHCLNAGATLVTLPDAICRGFFGH